MKHSGDKRVLKKQIYDMKKSKFFVPFEFTFFDIVYIYFACSKWTLDAAYEFSLVSLKPITFKLVCFLWFLLREAIAKSNL